MGSDHERPQTKIILKGTLWIVLLNWHRGQFSENTDLFRWMWWVQMRTVLQSVEIHYIFNWLTYFLPKYIWLISCLNGKRLLSDHSTKCYILKGHSKSYKIYKPMNGSKYIFTQRELYQKGWIFLLMKLLLLFIQPNQTIRLMISYGMSISISCRVSRGRVCHQQTTLRCTRPPQSQSGAIFCHLNHHCVLFKSAR